MFLALLSPVAQSQPILLYLRYVLQPTTNNKLTSGPLPLWFAMAFWLMDFNYNKNRKKSSNITFEFIYLTRFSWMRSTSVSKLQPPWSTWPWWDILPNLRNKLRDNYQEKII
jgi:hypothetical protein